MNTIVEIQKHPGGGYSLVVNGQYIRSALTYASARFGATAVRDALAVVGVPAALVEDDDR